jgi:hypothetical protein
LPAALVAGKVQESFSSLMIAFSIQYTFSVLCQSKRRTRFFHQNQDKSSKINKGCFG